LTTVPPNTTSYVDDGLALGTAYSYRVIATNALGDSAPSNQVDVTTPNVPPVPSGLQVIVTIVP
jgi:titin